MVGKHQQVDPADETMRKISSIDVLARVCSGGTPGRGCQESYEILDWHDHSAAALREDQRSGVPVSIPKSEAGIDTGRKLVGYLPRSNKGVPYRFRWS